MKQKYLVASCLLAVIAVALVLSRRKGEEASSLGENETLIPKTTVTVRETAPPRKALAFAELTLAERMAKLQELLKDPTQNVIGQLQELLAENEFKTLEALAALDDTPITEEEIHGQRFDYASIADALGTHLKDRSFTETLKAMEPLHENPSIAGGVLDRVFQNLEQRKEELPAIQSWFENNLQNELPYQTANQLGKNLAQTDPAALEQWLGTLPEGRVRGELLLAGVRQTSEKDPLTAVKLLQTCQGTRDADLAVQEFVNVVTPFAPEDALDQIETMVDEDYRAMSLTGFAETLKKAHPQVLRQLITSHQGRLKPAEITLLQDIAAGKDTPNIFK